MRLILKNIKELLTLDKAHEKDGRHLRPEDKSIQKSISLVCENGKISQISPYDNIKINSSTDKILDCEDFCVTPEIVDSHTHLVFGGDRSFEYSMRLDGASYEEIAKAGGGILHTTKKTNDQTKEKLFEIAKKRIELIHSLGVGTIEIKSGYGLNLKKEKEISIIIDDLKKHFKGKVNIFNTFMAAHAIPKEYKSSSDFMNKVVIPALKTTISEIKIDAVDIFLEEGYFDKNDVIALHEVSNQSGIPLKVHADEFKNLKGAEIAAELNALSADHLLAISKAGINSLASSDTVATLLPGTGYFLGKDQCKARELLDSGVKLSIASDYNPGSCNQFDLISICSLSAPNYKLNSCEAWSAITLNACAALGKKNQGYIREGADSRFTFFKTDTLDKVFYHWNSNFSTWPRDYLDYLKSL